jgi:erythromycin esterase-like protein
MGANGELSLGELVRDRHPGQCHLLGFTTHRGTVSAASDWGEAVERKRIRPSLPGSYERLFHEAETSSFLLDLRAGDEVSRLLREPRLERAIGVVYLPETERFSHYFEASLSRQFDAVLHIDHTRALEPLERTARWDTGDLPETFPFAE